MPTETTTAAAGRFGPPPRIDRHAHLEGSLDQAWVRRRAGGAPDCLEALWRGEAQPFDAFIDAFFFAARLITDAEAVRAAVGAAVARLGAAGEENGPAGIDLWCSPQTLVLDWRQIKLDEMWRGVELGLADAKAAGVEIALVLDAVNHFGPANGHALLDLVERDLPPFVAGFSTGGLERAPFREWAPVFDRARRLGLRCCAHAGENGPASNVREAVEGLGLSRIVHAVRSPDDPAVLELLAERAVDVDVCITSNRALVPGLGRHPLKAMMDAGVRCALGTDDPGIIPTTLAAEWAAAGGLLGGPPECEGQMGLLRRNAADGAWCLKNQWTVDSG
jgi:adenosine deaminase